MFALTSTLGFLSHPAMLAWLVAAGAPLIIHLLNKRKHREVSWAAMQYLLAAMRKNSRRIQIEQWVLLAIRTLLIVLLVLAVAEPFLEQTGLTFVSGQRTHKVLVLDGSYSMGYKPADKSLFERAKELAARIVEESSQGDGFSLVLLGSPPKVVVGTPAFEPRDFMEEIDNLRLLHGGGDLPATLAKVEEILTIARREHGRLTREEVYFITDMGRTTWAPDLRGAGAAADFLEQSQRLGASASVVVADLGQPEAENVALTSLRALEPYVTERREVSLEVEARNFGRQARPRQLLELFVDERRAGEQHIDLEPRGQASATFQYRFDDAGEHQLEIRLAGDLLDIDNHRYLSLPVRPHLRVLCVNGKPAGGTFQGATDYLMVALAPQGETFDGAAIHPEVAPESSLSELELSQYDCVFLANVGQFTGNEARVLDSYLEQGGGVVFFLGDQVQPESYNGQLLSSDQAGVNILPAKLGAKVKTVSQEPFRFNPLDYRHPLLAAFRGREGAGLLTTPVYQYFKLEMPEGSPGKVALAFTNGDPAIVERPVGRGRVILVATSSDADPAWTVMPMWPSYLPLVQELLSFAVRGRLSDRNLLVGQSLGSSLPAPGPEGAVTVNKPAGESDSVRLTETGDQSRWTFSETWQSGVYEADLPAPLSRRELFAVNVDPSEGDLSRVDLQSLKTDVWPGVRFEPFDLQDEAEISSGPIVRRNALHHWLLWTVLGLLFAETGLACLFARRAT